MTIDSHHHFWEYSAREYDWIGDNMAVIRRDFGPADLKAELERAGIDGAISVQARQSAEETARLLEMAFSNDFLCGVVGWVPLCDKQVVSDLELFSLNHKLKGIRHVVQGEADGFLAREDFNAGIALLRKYGLVYDVLVVEGQLPQAIEFVDRHPQQSFVLDHIAKPLIKESFIQPWARNIRELAKRENVTCKVSGMVTETDFEKWTSDSLRPYFETVLDAFGPDRLMFGSDWPVCLVACDYSRWVDVVRGWTESLSADEKTLFWGGTATRVYGL